MTPEAQRIAIAEACGWRKMEAPKELGFGASAPDKCWYFTHQLPDYLSDLNAMHEAVLSLPPEPMVRFCEHLWDIVARDFGRRWKDLDGNYQPARLVFATAAQRAEAFLHTLNLWDNIK